jgi:hypothetical protein
MGCGSSTLGNEELNLTPLSEDYFFGMKKIAILQQEQQYNNLIEDLNRNIEMANHLQSEWKSFIDCFAPSNHQEYGDSMSIAIGYLNFILSIYHNIHLRPDGPRKRFYFTNYLPGIIIEDKENSKKEEKKNEETKTRQDFDFDRFDIELEEKYRALRKFCINLSDFIENFKHSDIIKNVTKLNSSYIEEVYQKALGTEGLSIIGEFHHFEQSTLKNIAKYGAVAIQLDNYFKKILITIKNIQRIITKCSEDFSSFRSIVRGAEEWQYWSPSEEYTRKFYNYIKEKQILIDPIPIDNQIS